MILAHTNGSAGSRLLFSPLRLELSRRARADFYECDFGHTEGKLFFVDWFVMGEWRAL